MKRNEKKREEKVRRNRNLAQHPLAGEIPPEQRKTNSLAHRLAEKDMTDDAEFSAQTKNDDLDEGESARLGEDRTDLV